MNKIYEPRGRAREYSPYALNYFSGCDHGCQYCYVPRMMKVFRSGYNHADVSCNVVGIENEASRFRRSKNGGKQVLLSFTGDPYCGFENGQTWRVLRAFLNNGIHVSVLTKNPVKAIRDIDLMSSIEFFKIGTTLTCLDDDDSGRWEPGAPTGMERIKALKFLADQGIKTWASFEPVLYPDQSLAMLDMVSQFIDHVKIGKLNNHPREKDIDWGKFLNDAVKLCRERKMKFYIKNDLAVYNKHIEFKSSERDQDYFNV